VTKSSIFIVGCHTKFVYLFLLLQMKTDAKKAYEYIDGPKFRMDLVEKKAEAKV